jgi:hypothetical protein
MKKKAGRPAGRKPLLNLRIPAPLMKKLKSSALKSEVSVAEEANARLHGSFRKETIQNTLDRIGDAIEDLATSEVDKPASALTPVLTFDPYVQIEVSVGSKSVTINVSDAIASRLQTMDVTSDLPGLLRSLAGLHGFKFLIDSVIYRLEGKIAKVNQIYENVGIRQT